MAASIHWGIVVGAGPFTGTSAWLANGLLLVSPPLGRAAVAGSLLAARDAYQANSTW